MSSLKETIAEVISQRIALEDTFTYELKRVKSAFEVGTMSLEDFEEWTDENVDDLAKAIVGVLQPQLNENQQIVLEWLKGSYVQGYGAAVIRTIHLLQKENTVDTSDISYVRGAYRELNTAEEAVVVKMFADWALGQEEE
ncbi:hypothetical protein [Enterococcus casseliflavus]|uniref:hypothetical protein n=1 Tax=Enterococcus casseliflavus TaxID=37734 RepID=UPI001BCC85BC|nr:hypothetical protein [Enterococcus casseliflavus]